MPIYAYRCGACGHSLDVLQKLSDPLLTTCPSCGAEAFAKQVTAAGFQLKGSGWYVTDFRDNGSGRKSEAKGDAQAEGAADGKAGPAADAKPDAAAGGATASSSGTAAAPASTPAAAPAPSPAAPPAAQP